jgi:hypothetical protein
VLKHVGILYLSLIVFYNWHFIVFYVVHLLVEALSEDAPVICPVARQGCTKQLTFIFFSFVTVSVEMEIVL